MRERVRELTSQAEFSQHLTEARLLEMESFAQGSSSHQWHVRLLVAEVRRLRAVIRRCQPFLVVPLNPTAAQIKETDRFRGDMDRLCDSWLRPEAFSDTGDGSAAANETSGSGAAEPTETADPVDPTETTSRPKAARPGRPTRARSGGAK